MARLPDLFTLNGESLTVAEWAARTGVSAQSIRNRINSGWPIQDALTQPRGNRGKPSYASAVEDIRRRHERSRQIELTALHRDFRKLVHDIDRALNSFKHRLASIPE
jgi:hypothetical protein